MAWMSKAEATNLTAKLERGAAKMAGKNDRYEVKGNQWEATLNTFNSENDGVYLFPEKGRTTVRLLLSPERNADMFWQPVVTYYNDKARTRHMIPVLVSDNLGTYHYDIKLMVVAKTVLQGILTILAGGEYDFLHPEKGHGITIVREGEGLGTKYSVLPTKDPVPVDYDAVEFEGTLIECAAEFEHISSPDYKAEQEEEVPF